MMDIIQISHGVLMILSKKSNSKFNRKMSNKYLNK
jgi:hypothetical protein